MDNWAEYRQKMRELTAALEANAHYLSRLADALTDVSTACHEVAESVNRKAIGYEISEEYCQLIIERNRQQAFL